MKNVKEVCIGIIGAGTACNHHCSGYMHINGVSVRLKYVCDLVLERAEAIKEKYGIEQAITDYEIIMNDPEIDAVDIITQPFLHIPLIKRAVEAGKHVICEKPLTGYVGVEGDPTPIGKMVPKQKMYDAVMAEMDDLRAVLEKSDRKFCYCENWVYTPSLLRARDLLKTRNSKIVMMKGEETVNGSPSPAAAHWDKVGGGTLIRCGIHTVSGILWLKMQECKYRGEPFGVKSVMADCAVTTQCMSDEERRHFMTKPTDTEDYSIVSINFQDGTRGLAMSFDTNLCEQKKYLEINTGEGAVYCNMSPNDLVKTYFVDDTALDKINFATGAGQKLGWNASFVEKDLIMGYRGELQDFVECIAFDRQPESDFELAYLSAQVIYGAYCAAEEGRRFDF